MNKFLNAYFNYTRRLNGIAEQSTLIVKASLPINTLSAYGISSDGEQTLLSYLKRKVPLYGGTDGDDGQNSLSLVEAIDMQFQSKLNFLRTLQNLINSEQGEMKQLLVYLFAATEDSIEANEVIHEGAQFTDPVVLESFTFPYVQKTISPFVLRTYRLRQFFYNYSKDPTYFPTSPVVISTTGLEEKSREELALLFEPSMFYNLKKEQVMSLLQAAANEYLLSSSVQPCAVVFEPLLAENGRIQFGEYDPNRGVIVINSKLLDRLEDMKDEKNPVFPMQLLSTVIHESRHRVQFANLSKGNQSGLTGAINKALLEPQETMTSGEYLASLDEVDARNAALEYVFGVASATKSESLQAFYNLQKKIEQSNNKNEIASDLKPAFSHVYSGGRFDVGTSLDRARKEMFNIVNYPNEPAS